MIRELISQVRSYETVWCHIERKKAEMFRVCTTFPEMKLKLKTCQELVHAGHGINIKFLQNF